MAAAMMGSDSVTKILLAQPEIDTSLRNKVHHNFILKLLLCFGDNLCRLLLEGSECISVWQYANW